MLEGGRADRGRASHGSTVGQASGGYRSISGLPRLSMDGLYLLLDLNRIGLCLDG